MENQKTPLQIGIDEINNSIISASYENDFQRGYWNALKSVSDKLTELLPLEKEAMDKHAIEFAEWLIETENKPNGEFTIKQLLEIYTQTFKNNQNG